MANSIWCDWENNTRYILKLISMLGQIYGLLEWLVHIFLQFSTEDLVKEVESSIAEFKRQNQEYDEERVKEQVCMLLFSL